MSTCDECGGPWDGKKRMPGGDGKVRCSACKRKRERERERARKTRPEYKAKRRERYQRPETKAKVRERQRKYRERPETKAKVRERGQRPETKAKQRERNRVGGFPPEDRDWARAYRETHTVCEWPTPHECTNGRTLYWDHDHAHDHAHAARVKYCRHCVRGRICNAANTKYEPAVKLTVELGGWPPNVVVGYWQRRPLLKGADT